VVAATPWAGSGRAVRLLVNYKDSPMQRFISVPLVAMCACVAFSLSSCGQTKPPSAVADKDASADSAQPKPEDVLRSMADYLAGLPAFACRVAATIEVKASGMDNQMVTKMNVRLERPNRIAVIVEEGMMAMTLVSDGKRLVQYLPMMSRYTVEDAPPDFASLNEAGGAATMGMAGAVIPTSGEKFYDQLMQNVTNSEYLGTENIGEVPCYHCRFVQEQFSWDIWIEAGHRPLVHKIVPDLSKQFADAEGMMKDAKINYTIMFSDWNVAPKFTDADFAFDPPAGAEEVDSLFEGLAGGVEEGPHPLLGEPAPPFETVDPEGQAIDLSKQLGQSVVMLDFWATWCGPCVQAMPQVEAVAKKFADRGLVFYAVNAGEDADTVKEFLKTSELDVPVAMDPEGKINELYGVNGIPQTVLIGKDGKVQVVHIGYSEDLGKELTKNVEDLLAGKDLASEALAKAEKTGEEQPAGEAGSPETDKPADPGEPSKTDDGSNGEASSSDEPAETEAANE
jgi:peroxiredoxin